MTNSKALRAVSILWVTYGAYVVWLGFEQQTPASLVAGPIYSAAGVALLSSKRWALWLCLCLALFTIASWLYVFASISGPEGLGSLDANALIVSLLPGVLLMLLMAISAIVVVQHLRQFRF